MFRIIAAGILIFQAALCGAADASRYASRRDVLTKHINGSLAVLQGAPDVRGFVRFRQDNNFYYLTGVEVPNALLLLDGVRRQSVLFLPPRDPNLEQWEGAQLFPGDEARRSTGVSAALDLTQFEVEVRRRMKDAAQLYILRAPHETAAVSRDRARRQDAMRRGDPWDGRPAREEVFEAKMQSLLPDASAIRDLSPLLDEMRRIKDAGEIAQMRDAGAIGAAGFREAMRRTVPGLYEYQAAALAHFVFLWRGAERFAYYPIVGSGPNSCVLHYSRNQRKMCAGDLVVMDFGPDRGYYCADITRTFPVSGRFDAEQKRVYSAVLEAQKAAIAAVRPGAVFEELERTVADVLRRFGYGQGMPHLASHYVGMAMHDVGDPRPFEPGTVIAIEPGVYLKDKNLGVRIEDTVLVTEEGHEILTGDAPKEIDEIEALMGVPVPSLAVQNGGAARVRSVNR